MSDEELTRVCDCGACSIPLGSDVVSTDDVPGAFCSETCAGHAGGTLAAAKAEHREGS